MSLPPPASVPLYPVSLSLTALGCLFTLFLDFGAAMLRSQCRAPRVSVPPLRVSVPLSPAISAALPKYEVPVPVSQNCVMPHPGPSATLPGSPFYTPWISVPFCLGSQCRQPQDSEPQYPGFGAANPRAGRSKHKAVGNPNMSRIV